MAYLGNALIVFTVALVIVLVTGLSTRRGRASCSAWLDQSGFRPSTLEAVQQIVGGSLLFLGTCFLPITSNNVLIFSYSLLSSVAIAFGVEKLRHPPKVEYRPGWYIGDGRNDWQHRNGWRLPRQVSLGWCITLTVMMCLSLAVFSARRDAYRQAQRKHQDALEQIAAWGGKFQQGTVTLAGTNLQDEDLLLLKDILGLRELNLGATQVTNAGLSHLVELRTLRRLNLSGTAVDDEGVRVLAKLPLSKLRLRQTKVTGEGLAFGRDSPLVVLDLSRCPVSREGLRNLKNANLNELDLSETAIDERMIPELRDLSGITFISLRMTKLAEDGGQRIRDAGLDNVVF